MQPNTLPQPALRAAYPACLAILAAAGNAAQIAADFRSKHTVDDCDMEALAAAARRAPFHVEESHRAPVAPRRLVAMGGAA
ncbi:hypothetical protein GN316_06530 [Xylophilus sp. Kf1]|nr:hypothetical protein [Xylophilus sp. Kf1]